jgi:hypothetical protein
MFMFVIVEFYLYLNFFALCHSSSAEENAHNVRLTLQPLNFQQVSFEK